MGDLKLLVAIAIVVAIAVVICGVAISDYRLKRRLVKKALEDTKRDS
jgi:hypothetical protein